MWSTILGFVTSGISQYKIYVYGAVAVLLIGLGTAAYVYRIKAVAAGQERDFYQFQLAEAVDSHNGYVSKLTEIQAQKEKVQVIYRDRIRRINDEAIGAIDGPLVVFSMRDLDIYRDADGNVAH